jgi:hypothetical protein
MLLKKRPNGLPISRRERAADALIKTNDLAREAVGLQRLVGPQLWSADLTERIIPCTSLITKPRHAAG